MSLLKANSVQIGQSATATQNFTLSVPSSPDGTIKLARGNSGATTADVLTVDASGNVTTTLANGIVTPAKLSQPMTLGTALAYNWNGLTTNTSIDFTGIPSWVRRITVMFNGVSVSGTSAIEVRIGTASGIEATGYQSAAGWAGSAGNYGISTTGFISFGTTGASAANLLHGSMIISTLGSNTWVEQCGFYVAGTAIIQSNGGGSKTLTGGVLDRVAITTVGGANTFDAGSINIMYEG